MTTLTSPASAPANARFQSTDWFKVAGIVSLIGIALLLPHLGFTQNSDGVLPIFTIVLCAVYALFSLGLNIVVGFAGLLDLGYVAFFLFGAYVAAWLMSGYFYTKKIFFLDGLVAFDGVKVPGIHITFWLVVIIAGVATALIGVVIGAPTLRLKSDYLALVTLGFGEILPEVFRNAEKVTNGTKGIGPVDPIGTGFLDIVPGFNKRIGPSDYIAKYYVILACLAAFVFISIRLRDGRLGRAWMAIREDELAASLMGVPLMKTKLWSYAVGAFAGGVGGAFYATIVGTVNVDSFTFAFSIIILCAVILGGMGNVWGAILGGIVITWFNYTGLVWGGRMFNEASSLRLWILIAIVVLIGLAIGSSLLAKAKKSDGLIWMLPVAGVVAAAIGLAAVASKSSNKAAKTIGVLVALAAGIAAIVWLQKLLVTSQKRIVAGPFWLAFASGALAGSFLFRIIRPEVAVDLVKYQFGFFGLVLVLMMLFRPEGLLPAARSRAVKRSEALIEGAGA